MSDWEREADRLAARSIGAGDPTGWFEQLYAGGDRGDFSLPWDRDAANALLVEWTHRTVDEPVEVDGDRGRAVVVGCGLGVDAEHVASLGFATTAFDISPTAVAVARRRRPHSRVTYVVADVLALAGEWAQHFDLVVESYTVQALPDEPRPAAVAAIGRLVAPGGTLVVIASARDVGEPPVRPPPWPLTEAEVLSFGAGGLALVTLEDVDPGGVRRWRATFRRPP